MLPGCQYDPPWKYMKMDDLHHFLLERIPEGYSFPLNPVWPVRDAGWFEVHMQLMRSEASKGPCDAWYPPESGIREKMDKIHERFPKGFQRVPSHTGMSRFSRALNRMSLIEDVNPVEHADVLHFKVRPSALWSRARFKVMSLESIMNPFTPHAPLGSPRPSFCPRQSLTSSVSRRSTRLLTCKTTGEDLDTRRHSTRVPVEDIAEDQSSASEHSAENDAMLQPVPPPQDAPPVLPLLDFDSDDSESQPTITRYCSTPGAIVAQLEEINMQRLELVRSAASTPSWRGFRVAGELCEDDDSPCRTRLLEEEEEEAAGGGGSSL